MAYKNKDDQAAAARRHYEANKEKMKARAMAYKPVHRENLRRFVDERKSVPCLDCGGEFPTYVMQFDHVRGEKLGNVADMVRNGVSYKKLDDELDKCEVVCANCHAIRTWQRRNE